MGLSQELAEPAAIFSGRIVPFLADDELTATSRPLRDRDPTKFWKHQRVFQKRGIVIEDADYIVRDRYWELDSYDVGYVTNVTENDDGIRCVVLFSSRARWQERTFEKKPLSTTVTQRTVIPAREGYREESVATTYRIEGTAVPKEMCGVIIRQANENAVYVEFPADLLGYEIPRVNDKVSRGPDWVDGHADGWSEPIGEGGGAAYFGEVISPRDRDGNIDVYWPMTGRTTAHRFDTPLGFVDVKRVPRDEESKADAAIAEQALVPSPP